MDAQFRCENEGRRRAVENQAALNGIDYLEVVSANQRRLDVHFVHPLPVRLGQVPPAPAPALTAANIRIEGGVQVRNVRVVQVSDVGNVLRLSVDRAGDYSTYTLRLVTSANDLNPPPGFDPHLAAVDFSFKVACPSDFDCKPEPVCPPEKLVEPEIDYLAKDYASFRRLMLDRLSITMPDWQDRNPADVQIALVELLAYVGDHLSYFQDAVATEAYLGTARRRVSVRRHARLLDYFVHDGCNARAWVHFRVTPGGNADGSTLPAATQLRTSGEDDYLVFETMHDVALHGAHNDVSFYTWNDAECCLPEGATRATLRSDATNPLALQAGDVLVFEEVCSPTTGLEADADPAHRHAARLTDVTPTTDPLDGTPIVEVTWHEDDALPFPLCLTALVTVAGGVSEVKEVSLAHGNVVLADLGETVSERMETVPREGRYRPYLQQTGVTFAVRYDHAEAQAQAASALLVQDPRAALPAVRLDDDDERWQPRRDLLASDRFAADFVVEVEHDGRAYLRFGDDVLGKAPSAGTDFTATYRVGNGPAGNVGAEAISRIVGIDGIERVRNPMPAAGGTAGESMAEVRQYAPQAFRTQQRAVTEADYAEVAERLPGVQQAAARFRWTGSWYTVFVTVDRKGGLSVREANDDFEDELLAHLNRFRMAGYDLKIDDPVFVSLDLLLVVCVETGYFRSVVKQTLLQVFSRHDLPDGRRGFFHPDRFTFGQPVYLSQVYQAAMDVAGVASVEVKRFQRWGKTPAGEIAAGLLQPAPLEVVRLDNDPSEPENGKIEFDMLGGL